VANEHVIHRLEELQGCAVDPVTQAAIDEIMRSLGRKLDPEAAQEVAKSVPPAFALPVRSGAAEQESDSLDALYDRVAQATGWENKRAQEFTHIVMHVVAQALEGQSLDRTRERLPEPWSGQLDREPPEGLEAAVRPPPSSVVHDRSLKKGPIGITPPKDEGSTSEKASVASREEEPERRETLASGGRPAPAGEGNTLADGRQGSRRPLSTGK